MASSTGSTGLARRIGPFDATMIVMGGIVGSGIFANPREVALELPSAPLLLAAWAAGGVMALLGALTYAELAARRPGVGGQYAYLRDAYHPLAAFLYGWVLLLVVQTGGMAAVALIFDRVGRIHPRTRVPVVAIALQGAFAMLLTAWGQYRQILDYMVAVDFIFFGLTAACLFVFRRRDTADGEGFRAPGHPWTTGLFVTGCWLFVANLVVQRPRETLVGMAILLTGVPAYALWRRRVI